LKLRVTVDGFDIEHPAPKPSRCPAVVVT